MKLRHEFVLKALEPDANVAALCREYGVSRKSGYKWLKRFREGGAEALADMSRRPHKSPRASGEAVLRVIELRAKHPRWGPRKLHKVLARTLPQGAVPSQRTIARILERADMARPARKRRPPQARPEEAPGVEVEAPNDLWTVDFKGWWRSAEGSRCEPLTVRDALSRYVLCAELLGSTRGDAVKQVFERLFEHYGLPRALQVDNGSPFASTRARGGLTTLAAWWVSLGIDLVRGRPGHPEDNGGHERMHADIQAEVERWATRSYDTMQAELDAWRHEFNIVRPHAALGDRVPAEAYRPSPRRFVEPKPPVYPPGFETRRVSKTGKIKLQGQSVRISQALRGYDVGLKPLAPGTWRLWFYKLDLGDITVSAAPGQPA